jgi:hypothetical protein
MSLLCPGFLSNRAIKLRCASYIALFLVIILISETGAELSNDLKKHNIESPPFDSLDLISCFFSNLLPVETKVENDCTPPLAPGKPAFYSSLLSNTYIIFWHCSLDIESGVVCYELQEKNGISSDWRKINDNISAVLSCYSIIGRVPGHYYYRVRAKNAVGLWSEWSLVSKKTSINFPDKIITRVSNFPNPINSKEGNTIITYFLNQDAEITITIYDLMGYEIKIWSFGAGEEGGNQGINNIVWDCKDDRGDKIFKGCYLCRIRAKFNQKVTIVTRKIGVIY